MRIALVTENFLPKLDGVTRTLAMLLEHIQRRGHQAIVLGPQGSPRRYAGARVISTRGLPIPFYPELRILFPPPSLERRLALFRADIVHVVDPMILGAAGILWGQRLNVPVLSSYHTNLATYCTYYRLSAFEAPLWAYRRFLHNQCATTLCPSPSTARELRQRGFSNVGIWSRGVDSALFTPKHRSAAWRTRITGSAKHPIVLYTGRLSFEKSLDVLESLKPLLREGAAHLVLVGDGPARSDLEHSFAGLPVTFTGCLKGEALAEAYASSDVFAFPSTTETFGQAVQEAMASGLPAIAFDAEGVRDLVHHDATGLLVPLHDSAAFACAVRRLVQLPEWRHVLGSHARTLAEQRTWAHVLDDLLDTYAQATIPTGGHENRAA